MQISSLGSKIIISDNLKTDLEHVLEQFSERKIFIIVDENTEKLCLPVITHIPAIAQSHVISIGIGEEHKNSDSLVKIWEALSRNGADRKSVVINLGGGMIGDLGGFAAATFKRGVSFMNIPTTLLSQVDASIGGKLGINLLGLKNEIGLFKTPDYVFVHHIFLKTLNKEHLLAGFAEMIKHSLIYSASHWKKIQEIDITNIDFESLQRQVSKSIFIKNDFVQADFREQHVRKALNFGHTIGHAFETYFNSYKKMPISHGMAVAQGLICEMFLSYKKNALSKMQLNEVVDYILKIYGKLDITKADYEHLYDLMHHDKKNERQKINFTLLTTIGEYEVNQNCSQHSIYEALDYYLTLEND
jgi:3-dehydroquinate synthase